MIHLKGKILKTTLLTSNSKHIYFQRRSAVNAIEFEKICSTTNEAYSSPADYVTNLKTDEEVAAYYNSIKKKQDKKFQERVVQIRRVTKVVKGGKQLSFRAIVVIGDENGLVGVGVASSKEVIGAVNKAVTDAKKNVVTVPLTRNQSIPHRIESCMGASRIVLRPASEGTGVVAGGSTRVVLEMAGLRNIFGKQLGANNPLNNSRATIAGLKALRTPDQLAKDRGISLQQFLGNDLSSK
jgi:small subunit ribosomal protein S5